MGRVKANFLWYQLLEKVSTYSADCWKTYTTNTEDVLTTTPSIPNALSKFHVYKTTYKGNLGGNDHNLGDTFESNKIANDIYFDVL